MRDKAELAAIQARSDAGSAEWADPVGDARFLLSVVRDLETEVKHWKDHAEEAGAGFAQVCRDAARLAARNGELVRRVEALADEYQRQASPPLEPTDFALLGVAKRLVDLITPPGLTEGRTDA